MAVGDAYVFPGFLTPVLTQLFFPKQPTTFSHASAEVRGQNTPERKVASTGDRTHDHQVIGSNTLTTEPPRRGKNSEAKGEIAHNRQFLLFPQLFYSSGELSMIFSKLKCHLQTLSVWRSPKVFIWERVKNHVETRGLLEIL